MRRSSNEEISGLPSDEGVHLARALSECDADGFDGEGDGAVGVLALLNEVEYERNYLGPTEGIGRRLVEAGQIRDPMDIGLDGALGELTKGEVIDEFLP